MREHATLCVTVCQSSSGIPTSRRACGKTQVRNAGSTSSCSRWALTRVRRGRGSKCCSSPRDRDWLPRNTSQVVYSSRIPHGSHVGVCMYQHERQLGASSAQVQLECGVCVSRRRVSRGHRCNRAVAMLSLWRLAAEAEVHMACRCRGTRVNRGTCTMSAGRKEEGSKDVCCTCAGVGRLFCSSALGYRKIECEIHEVNECSAFVGGPA